MAARDRVGATQTIARTLRELLADSEWNNRVSERKWRGQCQAATGSRTGNIRDHGLFADRLLPGTAECRLRGRGASLQRPVRGHTLVFLTSMRWPLTGNCQLPPAVGGEQRGAASPSSAQPRTAALDRCGFGARQTRRAERECSVRPAGSARITSTSEWQRFRRGCVQCCGSFKPV